MTGIGSLIFQGRRKNSFGCSRPKAMYATIYPYKGALELWYQKHASLYTDFMIIFLTAWSIIFPKNNLVNKIFKDLPEARFLIFVNLFILFLNNLSPIIVITCINNS